MQNLLDKIAIDENSIYNPFYKILELFMNEALENEQLSQEEYYKKVLEYKEGYNLEWLNKNINAHYHKLINTILNILEVQNLVKNETDINCNIDIEFSIQNWLEYLFIKQSTLIELLDTFYEKYFDIKFKNKKEREDSIVKEFKKYLKVDISDARDIFKEEILNVRDRIIHDNGYSVQVFKMNDDILTFQVYDSEVEEVKYLNEIYSYYPKNEWDYKPPMIKMENYLLYSLINFNLYVENLVNLMIIKSNNDTKNSEFMKNIIESGKYSGKYIIFHKNLLREKTIDLLNRIDDTNEEFRNE